MSEFLKVREILGWLRGNLTPAEHFRQRVLSGTTPGVAGTEFTVQHDLDRRMAATGPDGNEQGAEFIYWLNGTGTLYEGNRADWTENSFTLRCSEASRGYVIIVR